MAKKIRQNDEVIMLTGSVAKGKGKRGKVTKVLPNEKAIVEGLNLVSKHKKPNPASNEPGGIIQQEAAIDISNLAIFNPATSKADRVGFRFEEGKKVRYFKSTNETIK